MDSFDSPVLEGTTVPTSNITRFLCASMRCNSCIHLCELRPRVLVIERAYAASFLWGNTFIKLKDRFVHYLEQNSARTYKDSYRSDNINILRGSITEVEGCYHTQDRRSWRSFDPTPRSPNTGYWRSRNSDNAMSYKSVTVVPEENDDVQRTK